MALLGVLGSWHGSQRSLRAQAPLHDALRIEAAARALQPGELVVLTIAAATTTTGTPVVHALGRRVPIVPDGDRRWRALVGIDLTVKPGAYSASATIRDGDTTLTARHSLPIAAKTFETRTLRVNPAFVEPPASEHARIQREAAKLRQLWTMSASSAQWSGAFLRPVPDPANSRFGSRSIFNGRLRSPHTGADFSSAAGTPVKAPNAGLVVLAESLYFSGNTVVIDHGLGLFSLFAHLSSLDVREGVPVEAGATVGRVGATGRVTGPHLHWAMRVGSARIDPLSLLAVLGGPSDSSGPEPDATPIGSGRARP